jgi:hypothetical protein
MDLTSLKQKISTGLMACLRSLPLKAETSPIDLLRNLGSVDLLLEF